MSEPSRHRQIVKKSNPNVMFWVSSGWHDNEMRLKLGLEHRRTPFSGPNSPQCPDDPKSYPVRRSDHSISVAIGEISPPPQDPADKLWDPTGAPACPTCL